MRNTCSCVLRTKGDSSLVLSDMTLGIRCECYMAREQSIATFNAMNVFCSLTVLCCHTVFAPTDPSKWK